MHAAVRIKQNGVARKKPHPPHHPHHLQFSLLRLVLNKLISDILCAYISIRDRPSAAFPYIMHNVEVDNGFHIHAQLCTIYLENHHSLRTGEHGFFCAVFTFENVIQPDPSDHCMHKGLIRHSLTLDAFRTIIFGYYCRCVREREATSYQRFP